MTFAAYRNWFLLLRSSGAAKASEENSERLTWAIGDFARFGAAWTELHESTRRPTDLEFRIQESSCYSIFLFLGPQCRFFLSGGGPGLHPFNGLRALNVPPSAIGVEVAHAPIGSSNDKDPLAGSRELFGNLEHTRLEVRSHLLLALTEASQRKQGSWSEAPFHGDSLIPGADEMFRI